MSPTESRHPSRRHVAAWLGGGVLALPWAARAVPAQRVRPATAALPPAMVRSSKFRRGASLGLFISREDPNPHRGQYESYLGEMLDAGVTDVQLVVRWAQDTINDVKLAPDPLGEEDDATVGWVIDAARRLGLRVFLMPTVHVRLIDDTSWRGTIAPTDWGRWWRAYERFILHYAELAQAHGVDLFAVGSELGSTESQADRWVAIIAAVRRRFSGALTYSANWDHFGEVPFWGALDLAGVNAYVPLSTLPDPSESDLMRGWRPFKAQIEAWSARHRRPFLLTEIGYQSNPFAAARPFDYSLRGQPDPGLQLRCYRALFRSWHDVEGLSGVFLWNWFGPGGLQDRGYTPRGKPAYEVIRHWYRGSVTRSGQGGF